MRITHLISCVRNSNLLNNNCTRLGTFSIINFLPDFLSQYEQGISIYETFGYQESTQTNKKWTKEQKSDIQDPQICRREEVDTTVDWWTRGLRSCECELCAGCPAASDSCMFQGNGGSDHDVVHPAPCVSFRLLCVVCCAHLSSQHPPFNLSLCILHLRGHCICHLLLLIILQDPFLRF